MTNVVKAEYRGRDVKTGEWVYGNLVDRVSGCKPIIVTHAEMQDDGSLDIEFRFVDPDTIEVNIIEGKKVRKKKEDGDSQFGISYFWGSTDNVTNDTAKDLDEAYAKIRKKYEKNPNLGWAIITDLKTNWCTHIDTERLCRSNYKPVPIFEPSSESEHKFGITMFWNNPEHKTFDTAVTFEAAVEKVKAAYKENRGLNYASIYDGRGFSRELRPPRFIIEER